MRKFLLVLLVAASACASRAARPTIPATATYACGDTTIARNGDAMGATRLGWHDEEGDHFVAWPLSPVDVEAVEVVVPSDPRQDAVRRVYDTSKGASQSDWRLLRRQVCT